MALSCVGVHSPSAATATKLGDETASSRVDQLLEPIPQGLAAQGWRYRLLATSTRTRACGTRTQGSRRPLSTEALGSANPDDAKIVAGRPKLPSTSSSAPSSPSAVNEKRGLEGDGQSPPRTERLSRYPATPEARAFPRIRSADDERHVALRPPTSGVTLSTNPPPVSRRRVRITAKIRFYLTMSRLCRPTA